MGCGSSSEKEIKETIDLNKGLEIGHAPENCLVYNKGTIESKESKIISFTFFRKIESGIWRFVIAKNGLSQKCRVGLLDGTQLFNENSVLGDSQFSLGNVIQHNSHHFCTDEMFDPTTNFTVEIDYTSRPTRCLFLGNNASFAFTHIPSSIFFSATFFQSGDKLVLSAIESLNSGSKMAPTRTFRWDDCTESTVINLQNAKHDLSEALQSVKHNLPTISPLHIVRFLDPPPFTLRPEEMIGKGEPCRLLKNRHTVKCSFPSYSLIAVGPEISRGVWMLCCRFDQTNDAGRVGIMPITFDVAPPFNPSTMKSVALYRGDKGCLVHNGRILPDLPKFKDGNVLTLILNMNKGSLHFFTDATQQTFSLRQINEPIRFCFYLFNQRSTCTILACCELKESPAKHQDNEQRVQFFGNSSPKKNGSPHKAETEMENRN
ncbi:hypothetical protein BLNAU_15463 [Blattamonas nauphoetae]|uniref:Uncharacterized protein n=1 Tax=Blattamonas nauphoetae TaxID=2049346 RepID=A0ABQ9XAV2_9EUKA|nr:hypothetical protein BLNAU_15463 [Blattamonas nauphoetae]